MSSIFEGFLTSPEGLQAFEDRSFVQAMLRFEAALAKAQAQVGLIPQASAQSIIDTCKVELFDTAKIVRDSARAGSLAIPMVSALKETVGLFNPAAKEHVHLACTSQDAIDTAMALVTRDALALIVADVRLCAQALLALARAHAATPLLARTLMQPASVTSFGFKCVGWAAPLVRSLQRLTVIAPQALKLQLGGTVGTLSTMNGTGSEVTALMAQDLGLTQAPMSWHTQRDEWVALGCELGLLTGSLGKIARDIVLMSQFEVGELTESSEPGRGGPSNMPHKHNPVASMVAIAASQRVPQRVAALLAVMPQENERAAGAWQAELAEWPPLVTATQGAARALAQALPELRIFPQRMQANLDAVAASVGSSVADEWFRSQLADHAAALTLVRVAELSAQLDVSATIG
jgi:3-carboxy-cis,cis-muconate cycloisomerase